MKKRRSYIESSRSRIRRIQDSLTVDKRSTLIEHTHKNRINSKFHIQRTYL